MPITLNDAPVTSLTVTLPQYGNWTARVGLSVDTVFAAGTTATLVIEDTTFVGAFIAGGAFLSRASYLIIGGAGAWRLPVDAGALRSDAGVRLSTAVNALLNTVNAAAALAGLEGRESVVIASDASRGPAHVRFQGTGSATLNTLGQWYMRPDGVTNIGARENPGASTAQVVIGPFDPSEERLNLSLPGGDVAALVNAIGGTVEGEPLEAPVNIRSLQISLDGGKLSYVVNP